MLTYNFEIEGVKIGFKMENGKDGTSLVGFEVHFLQLNDGVRSLIVNETTMRKGDSVNFCMRVGPVEYLRR